MITTCIRHKWYYLLGAPLFCINTKNLGESGTRLLNGGRMVARVEYLSQNTGQNI